MNPARPVLRARQVIAHHDMHLGVRATSAHGEYVNGKPPRIRDRIRPIRPQPKRADKEALGRLERRNGDRDVAKAANLMRFGYRAPTPRERFANAAIVDERELRADRIVEVDDAAAVARGDAVVGYSELGETL